MKLFLYFIVLFLFSCSLPAKKKELNDNLKPTVLKVKTKDDFKEFIGSNLIKDKIETLIIEANNYDFDLNALLNSKNLEGINFLTIISDKIIIKNSKINQINQIKKVIILTNNLEIEKVEKNNFTLFDSCEHLELSIKNEIKNKDLTSVFNVFNKNVKILLMSINVSEIPELKKCFPNLIHLKIVSDSLKNIDLVSLNNLNINTLKTFNFYETSFASILRKRGPTLEQKDSLKKAFCRNCDLYYEINAWGSWMVGK